MTGERPPPHVPSSRVSSPTPPPTPTADTAFLNLPFSTIFVGVIVYADKRTGWIQYDLLD